MKNIRLGRTNLVVGQLGFGGIPIQRIDRARAVRLLQKARDLGIPEIIPDMAFVGQEPPDAAIAGACDVSFDYASGLNVAEYRLGTGRFLLNTLRVR